MWDFAAGYYAANLTMEQRGVADRNGFPQKIPAADRRNNGVAGAAPAAAPVSVVLLLGSSVVGASVHLTVTRLSDELRSEDIGIRDPCIVAVHALKRPPVSCAQCAPAAHVACRCTDRDAVLGVQMRPL